MAKIVKRAKKRVEKAIARKAVANARPSERKIGREADELQLEQEVIGLLGKSDFQIIDDQGDRDRFIGDILLASRIELGRERRYAMEVATRLDGAKLTDSVSRFRTHLRQSKVSLFDEVWLITDELSDSDTRSRLERDRRFRVLDMRELRQLLAPPHSRSSPKGKAKTRIGKAIEANESEIEIAIVGLTCQLDDKVKSLRFERPNSDEAIEELDQRISEYERMRNDLENIRQMIGQFKHGEVTEAKVVNSIAAFRNGLRNWWKNGSEAICNRTYDAGLFISSVGLLSLMKADTSTAVIVAGALIGGKSVAGALKGLPKKLLDR